MNGVFIFIFFPFGFHATPTELSYCLLLLFYKHRLANGVVFLEWDDSVFEIYLEFGAWILEFHVFSNFRPFNKPQIPPHPIRQQPEHTVSLVNTSITLNNIPRISVPAVKRDFTQRQHAIGL